jgi:glutathione peroxidase
VLIVDTASACGFHPNLPGWKNCTNPYGDKGHTHEVVLGFRVTSLARPGFGQNSEIAEFCQLNYSVRIFR